MRSVISPCDEKYNRKRLEEIISSIEGFKKTRGVHWSTNKSKAIPFDYENIFSMTDDEIKEKVDSVLDKLNPIVKLLEDKLLSHSEELIKMTKV